MRNWLVIPVACGAAAAIAAALHAEPITAALAGAAIAQAVRALSADGPAGLAGAIAAALLAITSTIDATKSQWLALATATWTIALVSEPRATLPEATPEPLDDVRGKSARRSAPIAGRRTRRIDKRARALFAQLRADERSRRIVALLPATIAAVLAPGCVALIPIAAARLYRLDRRLAVAGIAAGTIALLLAVAAGAGLLAGLGDTWFGPAHPAPASIDRLAEALGPLLAVAAVGGLVASARSAALVACIAGALLVDARAGVPGTVTLGLAALCAGAGIARFAGAIRIAAGQAIIAATCGALLLLPPAWAAINVAAWK